MKNVVFLKGFWVTFAKVTVLDAKPANLIENAFCKAKNVNWRMFRRNIISHENKQGQCNFFGKKLRQKTLRGGTVMGYRHELRDGTMTFGKVIQNFLSDISYRPIKIMK